MFETHIYPPEQWFASENMNLTKEELKDYVLDNYDTTIDSILEEFGLDKADAKEVEAILDELVTEKLIVKSYCHDHRTYEYDPDISDVRASKSRFNGD